MPPKCVKAGMVGNIIDKFIYLHISCVFCIGFGRIGDRLETMKVTNFMSTKCCRGVAENLYICVRSTNKADNTLDRVYLVDLKL